MQRCPWAQTELSIAYHDAEWGVPLHEDRALFELLALEGAQAGLSWNLILKRRAGYRAAFAGFDPQVVAGYGEGDVARLLADPGIIRNRLKIEATLHNAGAFLDVQAEFGSFAAYLWRFVDGRPLRNAWRSLDQVPARSPLSDALSQDLKARGFKFVGSTICYAYLQSAGLINDHLVSCFRYGEV